MDFAEVIVPLPLHTTFTYSIPPEMEGKLRVGSRVIVPFGRRKYYTAIVIGLTPLKPEGFEVKPIAQLLDSEPIVCHPQLKFWEWMAEYYLCSIGDVMRAALPAGLKIESETFVELTPDFDAATCALTPEEAAICQLLDHSGRMMVDELLRQSGNPGAEALLARMIERGVLIISEKLVERYRSRTVAMVRLPAEAAADPEWRVRAFQTVHGAKKQETMLLALMQLSGHGTRPVPRQELMDRSGCSAAILKALTEKGVAEIYKVSINRFRPDPTVAEPQLPTLSPAQQEAFLAIGRTWAEEGKQITLLRGVTSSGKTEVYIRLIDNILRSGAQALYLVPEIALTTQLTDRLQRVFGSRVVVYHSKFTDNERVDIWRRLLNSAEPCVVIGARSAVFLPFRRLKLVIVDEEHEQSYKQFDPAPRYNGRDAAIMLASMHGAKTLLGSASPSVESYYKAREGRYGLVELTERFGGAVLPEITIVDTDKEYKILGKFSLLSRHAAAMVSDTLAAGQQAILFHNRRGFAPMARCTQCAHVPKCECCDVSLTYHRSENRLVCHYCGSTYPLPVICPSCREPAIRIVGYGTERVEDVVQKAFPQASILRMDLDSTRNKDGYQEIINNFSARKSQILVGTQMVTKGLDFDGVNLVGVLNADVLIHYPDFRSAERAFNMMLQVAGRAGRRDTPGRVVIQTSEPQSEIIKSVVEHDYVGFYERELEERRRYFYPPFTRLIYIYLRHRDERVLATVADEYGARLRALLGKRVYGPEEPAVSRVQSLYIRKFMLKLELNASPAKVKALLRDLYEQLCTALPHFRSTLVHYDVDPY